MYDNNFTAKKDYVDRYPDRVAESKKKYLARNILSRKATSAISSHRKRGFIVNLTSKEIKQMFIDTIHCPICGKKLDYTREPDNFLDMGSVDRINNETILDKTNVWIICRGCNISKRNMNLQTFITYCEYISSNGKLWSFV